MILKVYPAGIYQANCYIVADETTGKGFVVDPGGDAEGILAECNQIPMNIEYIILTHGHGDHIGAVNAIKEKTGAKILMNENDEYLTQGATKDLIPTLKNMKLFEIDRFINDGDIINVGSINVEVIFTPGHTPGGVTLKIGDVLLTGDTLFRSSIGRTDFPGGDYDTIIKSITEKLMILPENMKVYPGHGPESTIGYEKKYNPFLR